MIKSITSISYKITKKSESLAMVTVGGINEKRSYEAVSDITKSPEFLEAMRGAAEVLKSRESCPRSANVELRSIEKYEERGDSGNYYMYKLAGKLILPDCTPSIKTGEMYDCNYQNAVEEVDEGAVPLDEEQCQLIEEAILQAENFLNGDRGFED